MSDVLPTFRNNKDRLVYIIGEYKIPISVTVLSGLIWLAAFRPELPTPPASWLTFSAAAGILAVPSFAVSLHVARWLDSDDYYKIGIMDGGTSEIYDGKRCPPDLWHSKTVMGATPLEPDNEDGAFDYIVTAWNYYGDIGELEVRGSEKSDLTPAEADETKVRVDEYYENYHELRRSYSRLKATVLDYASQIHDLTVMRMMAQRESAEMELSESVTGLIGEMEDEVQDLPSGPGPDSRKHVEKFHDETGDLGDMEIEAVPPTSDDHDLGSRVDVPPQREPAATDGGTEK